MSKATLSEARTERGNNSGVEKARVAKTFMKFDLLQRDDSAELGRPIGTCLTRGLFSTFSFSVSLSVCNSHNFFRFPHLTANFHVDVQTLVFLIEVQSDCFNPGP